MYQTDDLMGLTDALKDYASSGLTAVKASLLAEVEARAMKGAEEAVRTPILAAYGIGGLALLLSLVALVRR
jgi:hypothetical protein